MKNVSFSVLLIFIGFNLFGQDSLFNKKWQVDISGFMDIYYAYDFSKPQGNIRQPFLYNHNRHNEFNVNLAFIKAAVTNDHYRANLALQSGTYVNDNYAAEQGVIKNILEANVGIAISKNKKIWLDAGVFPSHIGFESAISADNWTLTRSLLAENSPYFLSGAKVSYEVNRKWTILALVCNGWQRIQRVEGSNLLSFGTQVVFKPTDKTLFNWSTFVGTDDADAQRRMRYFNNLYLQSWFSEKVGIIAGFDFGFQQEQVKSSNYEAWWSPVGIIQYKINDKWNTALRGEYYHDPSSIIISTSSPNGFKTSGISYNVDYHPSSNIVCRIELRYLSSKDDIFDQSTTPKDNNMMVASSMALKF
jgi:hypothetical protein